MNDESNSVDTVYYTHEQVKKVVDDNVLTVVLKGVGNAHH